MDQVVLDLIDLDSHLLIFEAVAIQDLVVLFDVLLMLGDLPLIPLSRLFKIYACLSEFAAHLIERLASVFLPIVLRQLTLQVINAGISISLPVIEAVLL